MDLFKTGKLFRDIALAQSLQPFQYSGIIQDITGESVEIKPALLDLSARRLFQELPLKGNIGQKNLAKNQLLSELRPLYREEIIADLDHFITGILDLDKKDKKNMESSRNQVRETKSFLDLLPKRFDPRIPMGRKSYFFTCITLAIGIFIAAFSISILLVLALGELAPDYLTEESVPYPYWTGFFFLLFTIPIHLIDFRRAKAASIHYAWVWILITLSIIDCFASLNQADFISPIARIQGIIYLFFIFKANKVQVPWPRDSGDSNASLPTGLPPEEDHNKKV